MSKIIYTSSRSKRKPANNAKSRQLDADWQALLKKWDVKPAAKKSSQEKLDTSNLSIPTERDAKQYPSIDTGPAVAARRETQKYTGNNMLGVTTMHKSNIVPVFSQEEAQEVSRMRRG